MISNAQKIGNETMPAQKIGTEKMEFTVKHLYTVTIHDSKGQVVGMLSGDNIDSYVSQYIAERGTRL